MSKIVLSPNNSGTGVFTLEAPATNTDRTLTLPDVGGEIQVSGAPVTFPDGTQQFSTVKHFKNRIINGCFRVWQRATSQTTNGYGSDDRWYNSHNGSTKTHSRQSFTLGQTDIPGNPKYFSRTIVSSVAGAGNYVIKSHTIEDVETFSGKTAVLSFWAKADAVKNIAVEFTQSFGTGGSPSALITGIGVVKFPISTSWQRYSLTVNIPSVLGKTKGTDINDGLGINIWFEGGSNYSARNDTLGHQSGTFDIYGVQLEEGTLPTEFEYRNYVMEETMCKRYFETGFYNWTGYQAAGGGYGSVQPFLVEKRVVPTIVIWGQNVQNVNTPTVSATKIAITNNATATATGVVLHSSNFSASAEL